MLRYYSATLALSAMLMFVVQPIVSKIILPVLGGNPSVWNAVMMFFQLVLLLGYAYVHLGKVILGTHKQALLHALLLILSLLFLPLSIPPELLEAPVHEQPVLWLVGTLLLTVGVPFFALSANAPLLSSWLAGSNDPSAKNPYMLYAASNLGSMIGLLSYPFLVEPFLTLETQRFLWSASYGVLVAMIGIALRQYFLTRNVKLKEKTQNIIRPIRNWQRAEWIVLAFVPSSMMLAVTSHITTDISPIPLLWVLPLALYLLSFVFVFADRPIGVALSRMVFIPVLLPLVLTLGLYQTNIPIWPWALGLAIYLVVTLIRNPDIETASLKAIATPILGTIAFFLPLLLFFSGKVDYLLLCAWYVLGFFLVAMVCHGRLSELKPKPAQLTEFYFFLSLGGALGGIFNTLIAPHLFTGFYELHLAIALAFFLFPAATEWKRPQPIIRAALCGAFVCLIYYAKSRNLGAFDTNVIQPFNEWMWSKRHNWGNLGFATKGDVFLFMSIALAAIAAFCFRKNMLALGTLVSIILLLGIFAPSSFRDTQFKDRNFFGVLEVWFSKNQVAMYLTNGTTQHGYQFKDEARATVPTNYYSWDGPLGALVQAMRARPGGPGTEIAAVGLGAGTVACLAQEGQSTTFFEINPLMDRLAHEPQYFSYLRDCPGSNNVVMGDARLSMKTQPDHRFSLIILDAFNSDAIPMHLLTEEALELYMNKLAEHGVIAYHISNRHMNLQPVVGNLALTQNLYGVTGYFAGSQWVFLTKDPTDLGTLLQDPRFKLLVPDSTQHTWTDDYSDIISILNFY